ncbi:hypothetical protein [Thalassotalea euphylliae]|nr:hypothetical protein [Thalassotalea euphylliae]
MTLSDIKLIKPTPPIKAKKTIKPKKPTKLKVIINTNVDGE